MFSELATPRRTGDEKKLLTVDITGGRHVDLITWSYLIGCDKRRHVSGKEKKITVAATRK